MGRKVLFVHDGPLYTNNQGEVFGIHYTEEIKQRYLKLGNSVTFCMREKKIIGSEQSKYSRILNENFKFVPFPNFKNLRAYVSNKLKAQRIIKDSVVQHDILVARMPSASGSIAIKVARKYNIPYLVEMVACTYDAYKYYNWKGKLIAPYKLLKIQNIIKNCTHVVYVTKEFLQERYPTKGASTNCSNVKIKTITEEVLLNRVKRISARAEPIILGSIGSLNVKYKGHEDVIVALHKLKSDNLVYKYKIVGQGNPSRLQHLIDKLGMSKEIEIVGSLPSYRINNFLENIDLYIQPSKTEGLPRAVIEAMSMACPSTGSKVGGIPELLSPDCLFQAGNIKEIAAVIKSFTDDKLIQEANRNYIVAKQYKADILEERRSKFYNSFLKDHNFE